MSVDEVRKGSGKKTCFIIGCSFLLLLCVISGVALYIGVKGAINKYVQEYTEEQPRPLPRVERSEEEIDAVIERADRFTEAVSKGEPISPLVLSSEDINTLIQYHPKWKDLNDIVYVSIEDDKIRGEISLPLEKVSPFLFRGRYLNGSAAFTTYLMNGRLFVFLESAEVKGKAIPEPLIQEISKENLAKDVGENPETAAVLENLESIEVADGQLTLRAKSAP